MALKLTFNFKPLRTSLSLFIASFVPLVIL
jgi:hypothetical protein